MSSLTERIAVLHLADSVDLYVAWWMPIQRAGRDRFVCNNFLREAWVDVLDMGPALPNMI